jgi:membrane protease YdiL (CAAX protease family)
MTIDKVTAPTKRLSTLARVLFFYCCSLAILMLTSRLTRNLPAKFTDLSSVLLATVLTFLLVFGFTRWQRLRLIDVGVMAGRATIQRFIVGYIIGLSMAVIQVSIVCSFGHLRLKYVLGITAPEVLLSFVLYLFVACREELVFRSYLLRGLSYTYSSTVAMLIMIALFVVEHIMAGMSWKTAVIGSGLGGVLFGLAALKTRGLALPFGLHSAWNFGQWMAGFKNNEGVWKAIVDKGYEKQTENIGLGAFILVMAFAITAVILFYKRKATGANKAATAENIKI